jgi:hypothetical protein
MTRVTRLVQMLIPILKIKENLLLQGKRENKGKQWQDADNGSQNTTQKTKELGNANLIKTQKRTSVAPEM